MNCYDCAVSGAYRDAVAVCADCGAAVCVEHAIPPGTGSPAPTSSTASSASNRPPVSSAARPATPLMSARGDVPADVSIPAAS